MKKLMLLLLGFMAWNVTQAQCEPNENVPDSVFVEPLPFNADERPDGGIALPACVGELYEFTFTFNIPQEYDSDFGTIPIQAVDIPAEDGIEGLPASMDYVCDPPTCEFPAESKGCVKIFGTAEASEIGQYELTLTATIRSLIDLTIDVPQDLEAGSQYLLDVMTLEDCNMVSTQEIFASQFTMRNQPNPFNSWTQIVVDATVNGSYALFVTDVFGKQIHQEAIQLFEGENIIPFDGSQLPSGLYLYTISNGKEGVSQKMAISRN
jgi:hypothetical protein